MASTSLTLQSQMTALQADLKATLETFFANLPEMDNLNSMSTALVAQSKQITVRDVDTYVTATDSVQALKSVEEEIEILMNPFIDKLFKAHRASTAIRKSYLDPGQAEQKRLKLEREQFAAEEERKRREVPALAGTSFRSAWEWVLVDHAKLKPEFVRIDEVAIGKLVRAMHEAAATLVGEGAIRVIERKIVVDK